MLWINTSGINTTFEPKRQSKKIERYIFISMIMLFVTPLKSFQMKHFVLSVEKFPNMPLLGFADQNDCSIHFLSNGNDVKRRNTPITNWFRSTNHLFINNVKSIHMLFGVTSSASSMIFAFRFGFKFIRMTHSNIVGIPNERKQKSTKHQIKYTTEKTATN